MKPSEDEHHLNVNFWDCENAKKKKRALCAGTARSKCLK